MHAAPIPANEEARLRSLKAFKLIDTASEKEFEDITALAAKMLDMPIALISLIDEDRQWFKARVGLEVNETPRDLAFCAHAILERHKVMEVPDTALDERFFDNPLVTGDPFIRSYAGAPIVDENGLGLGTLCVIDTKPRVLNAHEKEELQRLANLIIRFIELRNSQSKYEKLIQSTGDLIYELDESGHFLFANQSTIDVLGYAEEELLGLTCWDLLEPGQRAIGQETYVREIREKKARSYHEFKIKSKSGKDIHIGQTVDFEYAGDRMIHAYVVSKDISELRQTRDNLKKSEEKYRLVSEGSSDMICLHEPDGSYRYISASVKNLLGYAPEELLGKSVYDLIHPDQSESFRESEHHAVLQGESIARFEYRLRHKSGHYVWMESYAKPIFDDQQQIVLIQTSSRDVSRRKQKEVELQQANELLEKYKAGLQALNTLSTTPRTDFDKALKQGLHICRKFLGTDLAMITEVDQVDKTYKILEIDHQDSDFDMTKSEEFPLAETLVNMVYDNNAPWAVNDIEQTEFKRLKAFTTYGIKSQIGTIFNVEVYKRGTINLFSKTPRKEAFSKYELDFLNLFAQWVGDLIFKEEANRQLLAEQHILKAFVLSAPAAIAMFDRNLHYLAASSRWYKIYQIQRNIIGKSHYEIFPEIGEEWKDIHQRSMRGEIIRNDEDRFERADGTVQWLRWEIRPWHNLKGEIGGVIMSSDDITMMKSQALELEEAKELAEASGKTKENFLSTMSHEIRTPLNAIIGTTRLLGIENPELKSNERFQLLEFSSSNLLSLINDVLDYNKINSGKLELDNRPFDLRDVINKVANSWGPSAKQKEIVIKQDIPDYNLIVNADAIRISQILNNLISNAIKFTDEGFVKITLKPEPLHGSRTFFSFEVKDTGCGIPKDQLTNVFESFHQVKNGKEENLGGTGLGLAITKQLIEIMGGSISVSSEEGWGTSIHFSLNLENAKSDDITIKSNDKFTANDDISILVVDDNMANQSIASGFLSKWGINSKVANNGLDALEKLNQESFDLVLMDLRMPVMDGYEATRRIRKLDDEKLSQIPIIALTASTMLEVRRKIKEAGMTDYLSKPFDPDDLISMIMKHIQVNSAPKSTSPVDSKWKYLSELFDNDEEKINTMLTLSVDSISSGLDQLRLATTEKNTEKIGNALHTIKPNLAHLDLTDLANRVPYVDANDFYTEISKWMEQVQQEIDDIRATVVS